MPIVQLQGKGTQLRDDSGHYTWAGARFPSVTTVLKVLNKPALLYWASSVVAKRVIEAYQNGENMDEVLEYDELRMLPFAQKDDKASLGSLVHDVVEKAVAGREINFDYLTDDAKPYAESAITWVQENKPKYVFCERALFNTEYGYAGTCDAVVELGGRRLVLDYKTSQTTYEDHALQLAAYRRAEFSVDRGVQETMPDTEGGAILIVGEKKCRLYDWECGEKEFQVFLNALNVYRWKEGKPKGKLRRVNKK